MDDKYWKVYLVECSDGTFYCGITNALERRLHEHNFTKKGAKYTRSRRPVRLVGFLDVASRSEALSTELKVKKLKKHEKLKFFT